MRIIEKLSLLSFLWSCDHFCVDCLQLGTGCTQKILIEVLNSQSPDQHIMQFWDNPNDPIFQIYVYCYLFFRISNFSHTISVYRVYKRSITKYVLFFCCNLCISYTTNMTRVLEAVTPKDIRMSRSFLP